LKILIVDDNDRRVRALTDGLATVDGIDLAEIHYSTNTEEALQKLSAFRYDILVVDVLVPRRHGEEPRAENSAALVSAVCDEERVNRPSRIIGITGFAEVEEAARAVFARHAWTLIAAPLEEVGWIDAIKNCVRYELDNARGEIASVETVDLVWITALRDPELTFVLRNGWSWSSARPVDGKTFVHLCEFKSHGASIKAAALAIDRMGSVSAGVVSAKAIRMFRPRVLLMTGICAGIPNRVLPGNVILATHCWDYQSGKHSIQDSEQVFEVEPYFINCRPEVVARFVQLSDDAAFLQDLERSWNGNWPSRPKLLRGPIASGSAVLADDAVTGKIIAQHRKLAGIDMELFGCAMACELADPSTVFVGIKAVSDFADNKKHDGDQRVAAFASAFAATKLMENCFADIADRQSELS
jgi:nucleoside phosphorylase